MTAAGPGGPDPGAAGGPGGRRAAGGAPAGPRDGRGRRALLAVVGALVLAAAALWAAARLAWFDATVEVPARGAVPVTITGGEVVPALTGVALLALAAVAAVPAAGPVLRRAVGVLLAAAGTGVAVVTLLRATGEPFGPGSAVAPPPGVPLEVLAARPPSPTAAPYLAVGAGGLMLLAAVLVVAGARRLPGLGSRYGEPRRRNGTGSADTDPDRAAWDALDAGRDPTAAPRDGGPPGAV